MKKSTSGKFIDVKNSIATKLLKVVFSVYLVIAIGVTVGHMFMEYRYQKNNIKNDLEDIQKSFEKGLAVNMWQMNQESLSSTFEGLMKIPAIVGVKIRNADGIDVALGGIINQGELIGNVGRHVNLLGITQEESRIHPDGVYKLDVFMHHFPILYIHKDDRKQIGEATIYSNSSVVFQRVKFGFFLLMINAVVKTAALWFIFLYFSTFLLRRPLAALASATENVSLDNLDSFKIKIGTTGRNELKILEESFNSMIGNLHQSIKKRVHTEELLHSREIQYRAIFEKTNDAIFVVEKETGRYLDANIAAEQLTGRILSELKQLTTRDITPDRADERLKIITESVDIVGLGVVKYYRPDGTFRIARLNMIPLDNVTVIGIARDITDEFAIEEKLRQSQKMEAIGTLAGGIAHDFNNILSAIFGYAELAKGVVSPKSEISKHLEKVLQAGLRAKDLVQQILSFSRQAHTKCIILHPASLVKETIKMLRPSLPATIEIIHDIDPTTGNIFADPTQINQVLMNLCTNAFHAMEEKGGRLEITVKEIHLSREDLVHEPNIDPGIFFHLSVNDSGSGISPEIKGKIFDPYYTTKEAGKGTGLGLSIIHGIVKGYGGFVSLCSEVDEGTVFHVFIPIIKDDTLPVDKTLDHIPNGNERILFVDDEEILTAMGKKILEGLGYHVTVSNQSLGALKIFQERFDQFDIVITDQTMPGMTGFDLARRLMQIRPDIPIILCTGYSATISAQKAKSMGIKEFALKPLSKNDLAVLVRKVLDNITNSAT